MKLITKISIGGITPVPWKASFAKSGTKKITGSKYTHFYKDKNLKAFQKIVQDFATISCERLEGVPTTGPIHLEIHVFRKTDDAGLWGYPAYKEPTESAKGFGDLRNIGKSVEDALENIVYKRDSQVCSIKDQSFWDYENRIDIEVYSVSPTAENFSAEQTKPAKQVTEIPTSEEDQTCA